MTEKEYLIAISTFTSFGPVRTKLLLSYFEKASKIWKAEESMLLKVGIGKGLAEKFINHRNSFDPDHYFKKLKNLDIDPLTIFDKEYPENLKEISDVPYVLYVKGKLVPADSRAVAIIGSRLMTSYGREVARKFATELSNFGITIVSGLALGVDAEAQKSTLDAGGRTIAVLASGLDIITPATNLSLAMELIKGRGAIISEYPLGHIPYPSDFAVRNRLISGLSKAVVAVEGKIKSGTFHTVSAAAAQGCPVFAIPGPITSPTSEGPNYLIQNGAKLTTSVKDILEELNMETMVDRETVEKVMPGGPIEAKILVLMEVEPLHLDEVVRISGLTTAEVSARLTIMEMKGMVKNVGNGIYRKL